jgi:hypothetical protein
MKFLQLLASKILPSDVALQQKAGILDTELQLTDKGVRVLLSILWEQNRQALTDYSTNYLETHKDEN